MKRIIIGSANNVLFEQSKLLLRNSGILGTIKMYPGGACGELQVLELTDYLIEVLEKLKNMKYLDYIV